MKEYQKHLDAFECYLIHKQKGSGTVESVRAVSIQCKVSERTVYKWHKAFDWDGREAIRSLEINKEVEERTNTTIVENKTRYLKIYHKLLDKLEDNKYNIDIRNANDLQLVIKGALLLQDEVTDNINNTGLEDLANAIKTSRQENGKTRETGN